MRIIIVAFLLLAGCGLFAQDTFTGSFENAPLEEVLKNLEERSSYDFFYDPLWVDSLKASGRFDQKEITVVMDSLLKGTNLNYYVFEDRVILTNNNLIIDKPALLNSFQESSSSSIEKGLVFSREYQNITEDENDLQNYVFEIGNRSRMQVEGTSTIAGYVTDMESGEPITGVLVYIQNPFKGTSTDENGFYSLSMPNGKHTLYFQYVGLKSTSRNAVLFSDGQLNVTMEVDIIALQEVTVESDPDLNVSNVQMGVSKINIEEVKTVPVVLGEKDIMKIATTKAGIQTVGEGASGFNVRGGKADQNLILLNDAPVYNPNHFFGFFSVFNSAAIENMELYKTGIPASFGGRLSSVFDITSKTPNKEKFSGEGGISPITSKVTLEVPIIKEKTALLVSGRTTYSNWILSNTKNANFNSNRVSFYDLMAHLDHTASDKDNIQVTVYMSSDDFRLNSDTLFSFSDFSFKNINGSAKWSHRFNDKLDATLTGIFANYSYDLVYNASIPNAFTQDFALNEVSGKTTFNYYLNEEKSLSWGAEVKKYEINPGTKTPMGEESLVAGEKISKESGLENAVFISGNIEVSPALSFYAGLRYSAFTALGSANLSVYEPGLPKNRETLIDTISYGAGEAIKTYHGPEWRASSRYSFSDKSSVKFSLARTRQYLHVLSNSASLSPTDTWRVSGMHLKPQIADQIALGYYRNFKRNTIELSAEVYYKRLQNLVDFKTGASFLLNPSIERETLQGPGKSYGIEISLQKTGRLSGWLNYAYARTFIKLDGDFQEERINKGKFFPTSYDKPHTINLVTNYKVTRRLSLSLNSTYNTGRPVTFPVAAFNFKGAQSLHFADRNAFRIPDYFRIDIGINLEGNHVVQKLSHSFWSLSVYNILGRDNPFSVFFDVRDGQVIGSQLIVFGSPIPTLSWNFKF